VRIHRQEQEGLTGLSSTITAQEAFPDPAALMVMVNFSRSRNIEQRRARFDAEAWLPLMVISMCSGRPASARS
jgi:hypothetical protein